MGTEPEREGGGGGGPEEEETGRKNESDETERARESEKVIRTRQQFGLADAWGDQRVAERIGEDPRVIHLKPCMHDS